MKICTVTCHNALNHGARLQACALLHYLNGLGHTAEVVDYRPDYMSFRDKVWYRPAVSVKEWAKLFLRLRQRMDSVCRYENFEKFSDRFIPRTGRMYGSVGELQAAPPQADVYIAGSDQIWNTSFRNGTDAAYYLDFGTPETKRISYAASFALSSLSPECEPFVKAHLAAFDSISVRESSGLKILSSLGFSGCTSVDPVFLLPAAEWDTLLGCRDSAERYILVYDVMGGCKRIKRVAKRLAKLSGCKIYSIGSCRLGYASENFTQAAPDKFVELVRNARCVVSNSFHGTAFAMIYHREFFVVDRADGLNERMHDLLSQSGLQSRLADVHTPDSVLNERISYKEVDNLLHRQIAESEKFLRETLSR